MLDGCIANTGNAWLYIYPVDKVPKFPKCLKKALFTSERQNNPAIYLDSVVSANPLFSTRESVHMM